LIAPGALGIASSQFAPARCEEKKNTFWVEVTGAGLAECDGLYRPSREAAAVSESGTKAQLGYWNGKMAWDRVDGKAKRSPSLSYSNTYKAWRLARLDGHLAYTIVTDADMPPTDVAWDVYKNRKGFVGQPPAPQIKVHDADPRPASAKPNVVFVNGGPGAGKGTMCELLDEQLGWTHLSAGDLLRAERKKGGPQAALIESYIKDGKIVPVEITVNLLKDAMDAEYKKSGKNNFLIDGFPRSPENVAGWEKVVGEDANVLFMLFFECPLPVLEERILKRAKWTKRSDDNVESLRKRFHTFKQETMPVVDFYSEQGKCIYVDTSEPRDHVYGVVSALLSSYTDVDVQLAPLSERSQEILGMRPYRKK
jgi:UMP-CMP kinase family protein